MTLPEQRHPAIELRGVTKRYRSTVAVNSISLTVAAGEFVCLLGPSGCGKTTTLNMVAGFLRPDEGSIILDGAEVAALPPHRRNIGMVFQSYALFPHLTVFENVAFGLRVRKLAGPAVREKVDRALSLVRLGDLAGRAIGQLSGGQQQRVALARALVYDPAVLLLDEPFSNLDAKLRIAMRSEVLDIQRATGITALFVTHDQEEALHVADRVVVMNQGRIEQIGAPHEVYRNPATLFVADFLGEANFIPFSDGRHEQDRLVVTLAGGHVVRLPLPVSPWTAGAPGQVMIRPEQIRVDPTATGSEHGRNHLSGQVRHQYYLGPVSIMEVEVTGMILRIRRPEGSHQPFSAGDDVSLSWPDDAGVVFGG